MAEDKTWKDEQREWELKIDRAAQLLPAWFTRRMMADSHFDYALVLATGQIVEIEGILDVQRSSNGTVWVDVEMKTSRIGGTVWGKKTVVAPTTHGDRTTASFNAEYIVAALELH